MIKRPSRGSLSSKEDIYKCSKGRLRGQERMELRRRGPREICWRGWSLKLWLEEAFGGKPEKWALGFPGNIWRGAKGISH